MDRHVFAARRFIGADGIVDPGTMARHDAAVIAGVIPGKDLIRHGLVVEGLVVLQGSPHLRAAHGHGLAISLHDLAPMGPENRPEGGIGVITVTDRDT